MTTQEHARRILAWAKSWPDPECPRCAEVQELAPLDSIIEVAEQVPDDAE